MTKSKFKTLSGILIMVCSSSLFAENIVFPKNLKYNDNMAGALNGAGSVINIANNPWNINCNNTGTVDVSVTLQRLFDSLTISTNTGAILYIPNGTYLVSKTFRLPECQSSNPNDVGCGRGWSIVGQSTNGAVIKLKAGTFTDPLNPRPVLLSGSGVAQNMNRFFNNFTICIDSNNAGADGIFWSANNVSIMRDVSIISKGIANIAVNLDGNTGKYLGVNATSGYDEEGPTLIQNMYLEGFKIGINSYALNAVTCYKIAMSKITQYCIRNLDMYLWLDSVTTSNLQCDTAVFVKGGTVCLIDAQFNRSGSIAKPAIVRKTQLFARNVTTTGYSEVIAGKSTPLVEYSANTTSANAFGVVPKNPKRSLNMPRQDIFDQSKWSWEQDSSKWASMQMFKSKPGGAFPRTPAAALSYIIDSLKGPAARTTLVLDGSILLSDTLRIRNCIRHVIGLKLSNINVPIVIEDLDASVNIIKLEKLILPGDQFTDLNVCPIFIRPSRPLGVIIEGCSADRIFIQGNQPCKIFIDGVCSPITIENPNAFVYMWHFNDETNNQDALIVKAGNARIFGWKTEGPGEVKIRQTGGIVELLGFENYVNGTNVKPWSLFDIANGQFSAAAVSQMYWPPGLPHTNLCTVHTGTDSTTLKTTSVVGGVTVGENPMLISAWDSTTFTSFPAYPEIQGNAVISHFPYGGFYSKSIIASVSATSKNNKLVVSVISAHAGIAAFSIIDVKGRTVSSMPAVPLTKGNNAIVFNRTFAKGVYLISASINGSKTIQQNVIWQK